MVSLRKLFLVPAALVLVAGVASAAAATVINCAAPAPSTGVLRSEGRTELLPTLTFSCTVAPTIADTAVPFTVSVYPTGTATFTSPATGAKAPAITLGALTVLH